MSGDVAELYVFESDGRRYHAADVSAAFRRTGIASGDSVFVHSNLQSFGRLGPAMTRDAFIDSFLIPLRELVGASGNLIVPTFSYSFCKGLEFDPLHTPSSVGILTERFRKLDGVLRSRDPIFSVAAMGADGAYFVDVGEDCFGSRSIFEKLLDRNATLLFIGDTFDITFMHFVEQRVGVPYRYIKSFAGNIRIGGDLRAARYDYYVRSLDLDVSYDLERIAAYLKDKRILSETPLGRSKIRAVRAVDCWRIMSDAMRADSSFFLKKK